LGRVGGGPTIGDGANSNLPPSLTFLTRPNTGRHVVNKQLCVGAGVVALALSLAVSPVLAQAVTKGNEGTGKAAASTSASNQTERGPDAGQTGIGPRGTKVAPSTQASNTPGQPGQPATDQTGVEPRGTKVAPSTNPGQSGEQTR
jgi:hypothetical protein